MEDSYLTQVSEIYSLLNQLPPKIDDRRYKIFISKLQEIYNQINPTTLSVPQREEVGDIGEKIDEIWGNLNSAMPSASSLQSHPKKLHSP